MNILIYMLGLTSSLLPRAPQPESEYETSRLEGQRGCVRVGKLYCMRVRTEQKLVRELFQRGRKLIAGVQSG